MINKNFFMLASAFVSLCSCLSASVPEVKAPAAEAVKGVGEAKPLSLKIDGKITVLGAGVVQRDEGNGKAGVASFQVPVSDLNFIVGGKSSSGVGYGYHVRLRAITDSASINRSYAQIKGDDFGVFQLGNVKGPDDTMGTRGAYNLLGGTGGVDGSVSNFYNMSEGVIQGTTIIGSPGVATKMAYYTPSLNGWKAGLSFTPDTSHRGKQARDNTRVTTKGDDGNENCIYPNESRYGWGLQNWAFALSYDGEWGNHKLNLNFVTIREKGRFVFLETINALGVGTVGSRTPYDLQRTNSYMISAQYTFKDFDIAASFLDNGKSRLPTKLMEDHMAEYSPTVGNRLYMVPYFPDLPNVNTYDGDAGKAWNVGAKYTFGSYEAAIGYFRTVRKTDIKEKTTMDAVTATVDFKALEGLVVFGEVTAIKSKTNKNAYDVAVQYSLSQNGQTDKAIANNSGAVFMAGTKISF